MSVSSYAGKAPLSGIPASLNITDIIYSQRISEHQNMIVAVNAADYKRWDQIVTNFNKEVEDQMTKKFGGPVVMNVRPHWATQSEGRTVVDDDLPHDRKVLKIANTIAKNYYYRKQGDKAFEWGNEGDCLVLMDDQQFYRWVSEKSVEEILAIDKRQDLVSGLYGELVQHYDCY